MSVENAGYEEHVLPNGQHVFYIDASHTYIINGAEVPSITSLLPLVYGDTYSHVKPEVLRRAAEYGTAVHAELQMHLDRKIENKDYKPTGFKYVETQHYFNVIEPVWDITPVKTEQVVVLYNTHNMPVAAGRFDLLCEVKGQLTLVDFKTTSTLHKTQVTAQLNLYRKAAIQSGYFNKEDNVMLGAIQLHGDITKYSPVTILDDEFYLNFLI